MKSSRFRMCWGVALIALASALSATSFASTGTDSPVFAAHAAVAPSAEPVALQTVTIQAVEQAGTFAVALGESSPRATVHTYNVKSTNAGANSLHETSAPTSSRMPGEPFLS